MEANQPKDFDNVNRLKHTVQPQCFRIDPKVPEWVYFPSLHLIIGWGRGMMDTLGQRFFSLRHIFVPVEVFEQRRSPAVMELIERHWQHHAFRDKPDPDAPTLRVIAAGTPCVLLDLNGTGTKVEPVKKLDCARHRIIASDGYRVSVERLPGAEGHGIMLERRTKRLKPEFQRKMAKIGLTYEPGPSKRAAKEEKGADALKAQTFAALLWDVKQAYITRRVKILTDLVSANDGSSELPASFVEARAAIVRSRLGEIQRKQRDERGMFKAPLKEEELLARAVIVAARREANEIVFDFDYKTISMLTVNGIILPPAS